MELESVISRELANEGFVGVGVASSQIMVQVNDGQNAPELRTSINQRAQQSDGISTTGNGNSEAVARADELMLAHELEQLGKQANIIVQRLRATHAGGGQWPKTRLTHILCHYSLAKEERTIRRIGEVWRRCVSMGRKTYIYLFVVLIVFVALGMTGCGGNVGINTGGGGAINCGGCGSTAGGGATGGIGAGQTAPLTLTLIDPPTCASPRTNFSHLYLSVSGVQLNPDANATASSTGWVDVAPALAAAPKQLDLFNPNPTLGNLLTSTTQAGSYGSLRLLLATNSSSVTGNQCGGQGVHCVVAGASTTPIFVATETDQGIVVNSTSIAGGTITVGTSGTNVNILVNSCSSLIPYFGGYRLLPEVKAWGGAVQTYIVSMNDSVSLARLGGGSAIVAMEQPDANGVDRIFSEATPDVNGIATMYGPQGSFDFVAVATGVSGGSVTMYSPLAVTGVTGAGGNTSVSMLMRPQGVAERGLIDQTVNSNSAIDVRLSVLQQATINGTVTQPFTIPLLDQLGSTLPTPTILGSSCTSGACEESSIAVPSQPLIVQTFGSATQTLSSSPIAYTVFAQPFISQGAGVKNCTTAAFGTSTDTSGGPISPLPNQSVVASALTFAGCQ